MSVRLVGRVVDARTHRRQRLLFTLPLQRGAPVRVHSVVSHEGFPRTDVYSVAEDGALWLERIECRFDITGNPWTYPDRDRIHERVGVLQFFVGAVGNQVIAHGTREIALAPLADLELVELSVEHRSIGVRFEEGWAWITNTIRSWLRKARSGLRKSEVIPAS